MRLKCNYDVNHPRAPAKKLSKKHFGGQLGLLALKSQMLVI